MATRAAIARVKAQGSAHEGAGHWMTQRLTAIANIPLVLWFIVSAASLSAAGYTEVRAWLAAPLNAILMVLLIVSVVWHARLGIQVVIEDYVHQKGTKVASLVALKLAAVALAVSCLVAILRVSLGS